ncbi:transposase [Ammoniphilus oxalaticus]|uniref:Transposase n=1 Tax=Ammoniphilus oxalaticus TaxID=66863 RepID=A0A419SNB6_9BACL|nr:transposase [Ammoniphilus oxalaticus]RKD25786.1 transposase [Ammoniphilus oxalaticus]
MSEQRETRQRYNEEFKRQTVKYIQEQTKTVTEIGEELNIPAKTLHSWLAKYRQFEDEPIINTEKVWEQERIIKEQNQQIDDLKEELAILKKAVHIFSNSKK